MDNNECFELLGKGRCQLLKAVWFCLAGTLGIYLLDQERLGLVWAGEGIRGHCLLLHF